jgi:hypothetical protein
MNWSIWPLLKRIASQPTGPKRNGGHPRDPQLRNRQGIGWSRTLLTRAPPRNNPPGRWVARPPQQARFIRPPTPQPQQQQQQGPRSSFPPSNQGNNNHRYFNCSSPSHFIKDCPQPRRSFPRVDIQPEQQGQGQEAGGTSPPREGELHDSLRTPPRVHQ